MKKSQMFKVLCSTITVLSLFAAGAVCQLPSNLKMSVGDMKIVGTEQSKGTINPDKGETVKIYFIGGGKGKYDLRIYSLAGEVIHKDSMNGVSEGMFEWAPGQTASGTRVAQIKGPGIDKKKKFVIIK